MSNTGLATRCPACHTVFRVVPDQLRVSEGWVRCGRCSEVFNASENFVDVEAIAAPTPPTPPNPSTPTTPQPRWSPPTPPAPVQAPAAPVAFGAVSPAPKRPTRAPDPPRTEPRFDSAPDAEPDEAYPPHVDEWADSDMDGEHRGQPSIRMPPRVAPAQPQQRGRIEQPGAAPYGTAYTAEGPVREEIPMFETRAVFDTADIARAKERSASRGPADPSRFTDSAYPGSRLGAAADSKPAPTPANETPSFVRQAERAERWRSPPLRAAMAGLATLLAALLVAQVAITYRDLVAAHFPASKPLLQSACAALRCTVEAARAIDSLAVESSGLVRQGRSNLYKLQLTLRNRAGIEVAVPAMDITLTDVRGAVIARKVLRAADMASTISGQGNTGNTTSLAAGRELALVATLQSTAATPSGVPDVIAGYTVELFYP
jgi:predicted Zn finger-like uncharacterized protein